MECRHRCVGLRRLETEGLCLDLLENPLPEGPRGVGGWGPGLGSAGFGIRVSGPTGC